jgi:esterase/lipase
MGLWDWPKSSTTKIRGVAIVAHGLNLKPTRMMPLAHVLEEAGILPVCLAFSGHAAGLKPFSEVTRELWHEDFLEAYGVARTTADELRVPLYFLGYSLGALIGQDVLMHRNGVHWDRQVLLAPATHPRTYTQIVHFLRPFSDSFALPSLNVADYAAGNSLALAAYRALFECKSHFKKASVEPLRIPTHVLIDPRDEMVDAKKIRAWITEKKLREWTFETLHARGSLPAFVPVRYRHLIIDEPNLGTAVWNQLIHKILFHFNALNRGPGVDLTA